ncbi:hypothetical protein K488DRAFT_92903 [Vararia minispora EC-137]|uniref:Uncharacterized protein n=1 Tax=Vararia minispora EC-137 TaxID=1314806 RepID=A0ACB8Q3K0_9AGAM|nr:hypothetical protein K488DRAFT_92903 [Vararia minispora EC-137]
MRSLSIFIGISTLFAAIQVGAGRCVPGQSHGMLVRVAAEHRPHAATHVHGCSTNPGDSCNVINKVDDVITEASTTAASPAVPTLPSTDATPTTMPDFRFMISPLYAWGHFFLQKLLPVEQIDHFWGHSSL